ncbi:kelch-like protein 40b, partial [Biomphalaria glabrata]
MSDARTSSGMNSVCWIVKWICLSVCLFHQTSPEFEKLTCKELCFILRADQLNAKHEELVLDAIIRWVIADTGEREKYIPELVSCARVGLMMPDNMGEFVDSWLLSRDLNSDLNKVTLQ